MQYRCAILDDYQNVALASANWSALGPEVEISVLHEHLEGAEAVVAALADFDILCLMRERTPLSRDVIERLPKLKLILTTGMRNVAIDVAAARNRGVLVCGTGMGGPATAELVFAHILEFARKVGLENARLRLAAASGEPRSASSSRARRSVSWGLAGLAGMWRRSAPRLACR